MKKLIAICLISLPSIFQLSAGDSYIVETEDFKLEITKLGEIVPYKLTKSTDSAFVIIAKTSEIIKYLNEEVIDLELTSDNIYSLRVEGNKELDEIKTDILHHFLQVAEIEIIYHQKEQTHYILSYLTDQEATKGAKDSKSVQLNLDFKKGIILKGLSLEKSVESLNQAMETTIFEVGKSNLNALPKIHFVKRKLESEPVAYLKSKGFEVDVIRKVVDIPVLVASE